MTKQNTNLVSTLFSNVVDDCQMSVDDLLTQLSLENYCMVPCQD